MNEESTVSRNEQHHYYFCCWPPGRSGWLFCGSALILVGAVWLASNLGWVTEDWWSLVLPVLLAGWGIAILAHERRPNLNR